jgi:hypothetical protein
VAVYLWTVLNRCLYLYNSIGKLPYATLAVTDGFVCGLQICGNSGMFCKFLSKISAFILYHGEDNTYKGFLLINVSVHDVRSLIAAPPPKLRCNIDNKDFNAAAVFCVASSLGVRLIRHFADLRSVDILLKKFPLSVP